MKHVNPREWSKFKTRLEQSLSFILIVYLTRGNYPISLVETVNECSDIHYHAHCHRIRERFRWEGAPGGF